MEENRKYNPHIYCMENLSEDDRELLLFWRKTIYGVLDSAADFYEEDSSSLLEDIKAEIIGDFCMELKEVFGSVLQDFLIEAIDSYGHKMKSVKNPVTMEYDPVRDDPHFVDSSELNVEDFDDKTAFDIEFMDKICKTVIEKDIKTFFELTQYVSANCNEEERAAFFRHDHFFVDLMKSKAAMDADSKE